MITPRYDLVLFDWDGCLARTLDAYVDAYRLTLDRLGLRPTDLEITGVFGSWSGVRTLGVTDEAYEQWLTDMLTEVDRGLTTAVLYDGAKELVERTRAAGVKTALITTSMRSNLEPVLHRTGMAELFDTIIAADDTERHKPDPAPLHEAIRRLGSPERVLMVGDSKSDLGAARNAGVDSALMYPEAHQAYYSLAELRGFDPTYICDSFAALGEVLLPRTAVIELSP